MSSDWLQQCNIRPPSPNMSPRPLNTTSVQPANDSEAQKLGTPSAASSDCYLRVVSWPHQRLPQLLPQPRAGLLRGRPCCTLLSRSSCHLREEFIGCEPAASWWWGHICFRVWGLAAPCKAHADLFCHRCSPAHGKACCGLVICSHFRSPWRTWQTRSRSGSGLTPASHPLSLVFPTERADRGAPFCERLSPV